MPREEMDASVAAQSPPTKPASKPATDSKADCTDAPSAPPTPKAPSKSEASVPAYWELVRGSQSKGRHGKMILQTSIKPGESAPLKYPKRRSYPNEQGFGYQNISYDEGHVTTNGRRPKKPTARRYGHKQGFNKGEVVIGDDGGEVINVDKGKNNKWRDRRAAAATTTVQFERPAAGSVCGGGGGSGGGGDDAPSSSPPTSPIKQTGFPTANPILADRSSPLPRGHRPCRTKHQTFEHGVDMFKVTMTDPLEARARNPYIHPHKKSQLFSHLDAAGNAPTAELTDAEALVKRRLAKKHPHKDSQIFASGDACHPLPQAPRKPPVRVYGNQQFGGRSPAWDAGAGRQATRRGVVPRETATVGFTGLAGEDGCAVAVAADPAAALAALKANAAVRSNPAAHFKAFQAARRATQKLGLSNVTFSRRKGLDGPTHPVGAPRVAAHRTLNEHRGVASGTRGTTFAALGFRDYGDLVAKGAAKEEGGAPKPKKKVAGTPAEHPSRKHSQRFGFSSMVHGAVVAAHAARHAGTRAAGQASHLAKAAAVRHTQRLGFSNIKMLDASTAPKQKQAASAMNANYRAATLPKQRWNNSSITLG